MTRQTATAVGPPAASPRRRTTSHADRSAAGRHERLAASLEQLASRFGPDDLGNDPLLFPKRYATAADREVVALIAALFAYGRVAQIRANVETLLSALGPSPAARAVELAGRGGTIPGLARDWTHRFNDARDAAALIGAIGRTLRAEGSLEALFAAGDVGDSDLHPALVTFARALRRRGEEAGAGRGWDFLASDPARGGASKRWNLFLRWVSRPGPIDLRLWTSLSPARLVLPMDAHVARISRHLRLTTRKTNDWKAACEATRALARIDPSDPVRFDFALCRLGIVNVCRARPEKSLCDRCPVADCCPVPGGGRSRTALRSPRSGRPLPS